MSEHVEQSIEKIGSTDETAVDGSQQPQVWYRSAAFWLMVSVFAAVIAQVVLVFLLPRDTESIFLHYNIYFGVDSIGPWEQILWIPGSGLLIAMLHIALVRKISSSVVQNVLNASALVIELLLVLALCLLIRAN